MSTDSTEKKSIPIYKKTAFWIIIASIVVISLVGIFAGTVIGNGNKFDLDSAISQAIIEHNSSNESERDVFSTEAHSTYCKQRKGNQITVYLQVSYEEYAIDNPLGIVEQYSGGWCPCAITFEINEDGSYEAIEYWEPEDGSYYASSIKKKFPHIFAYIALYDSKGAPEIDMSKVYEHFNAPKTVSFVAHDSGHLFCEDKGDAVLTLNTETSYATLKVNGKEIFTDFYSFFDFDDNGDPVDEYIYLCDVDNLPNNRFEYDFTVVDKNTLCVTNLPEKPLFTRIEE